MKPSKTTFYDLEKRYGIFCIIGGHLGFLRDNWPGLEDEIPQNKNVILNTKVKFLCPLCTQTWCIIMIIET